MDWFTWLSKTGLNPALVYEYGLAFTRNELEEDDIPYFDHEFLQSMGISVAKHRLEILKLARKQRSHHQIHGSWAQRPDVLLPRLLVAIKSTKRRVERYIKSWVVHSEEGPSSAIVLVDKDNYGRPTNGYSSTPLKRKKKTASVATPTPNGNSGQAGGAVMGRLLLTDGSSTPARDRMGSVCESPVVYATTLRGKKQDDAEEGYWSPGVDKVRWDSLFQDLKPT